MLSVLVASFRKQFTSFHTELVIRILFLCQIATKFTKRALLNIVWVIVQLCLLFKTVILKERARNRSVHEQSLIVKNKFKNEYYNVMYIISGYFSFQSESETLSYFEISFILRRNDKIATLVEKTKNICYNLVCLRN
jgi:hypothetical protein